MRLHQRLLGTQTVVVILHPRPGGRGWALLPKHCRNPKCRGAGDWGEVGVAKHIRYPRVRQIKMAKKGSGKRKRKKSSSSKPSFAVWFGILLLPCAFYGGLHMCVKQGNFDTVSPENGLEKLTALQNEKLVLSHKIQAVSNSLHPDHQNAIALPTIETRSESRKQPSAHQTFKGKLAELLRGTSWSGHINHIQIGKGEYKLKVSVTKHAYLS